jgi:DNA gyrase subunit A
MIEKMADLVNEKVIEGISDIRDESSSDGIRVVVELKRGAMGQVVLNNLYKHTQLQETFGANMLALVDGVPRARTLDSFVRHWTTHQLEVVVRRTQYLLREAEARAHILRGYLKALDALDQVIALIRASATVDVARQGLIELLDIDEIQANAILELQLRRLAAMERQKILDEHAAIEARVADYRDILANPDRQRGIVATELTELVEKFGDERRTRILPFEGEVTDEDLIPEEDVVVTITRGGYAKRTRVDAYRSQRRGGKGVKGAQLREDDIVEHFFVTTTHHWLLFFTNFGRVYRTKGYELPEGSRDAKGQHVANMLAFQPEERIAQVLAIRDYEQADYLVLATKRGLVKKTRLTEYDSPRSGGIIAVNLREDAENVHDEVVSARLVDASEDLILVSRKGQSVRFTAWDESLRPMGRATSGVTGMKFRADDELLAMDVIREGSDVFIVTEGGYAKRTPVGQYRVQGRGGLGIKVAKLAPERGDLVGALITGPNDEVMVIMEGGKVVRSKVEEVPAKGRDTMGVVFAKPDQGDRIIAVARNAEGADGLDAEIVNDLDPATPDQSGNVEAPGDAQAEGNE